MSHGFKKGFTLVELIVVITILSVLATVAFISFQWYSTQSRDTKRMTDIATISKWLQVYLAANSNVPEPSETKVLFNTWSVNMIVQWYAWDSVLNTIRVQDAKDPTDDTFYTYSTNAAKTKFQLMALLENEDYVSKNLLNSQTYADYSNRYIYLKGQKVWILTNPVTHIPIQELWNDIDISTNLDDFEISFWNDNSSTLSWDELYTFINDEINNNIVDTWSNDVQLTGWRALDPNCPIDDIVIWSQTWAWCNSTLGIWFEWWKQDDWSDGSITNCDNYEEPTANWDSEDCSIWDPLMSSDANPKDFFDKKQPTGKNSNEDSEFDTIWWKFYTFGQAESACPSGWSVPSNDQWSQLEQQLWSAELWWYNHNLKNNTDNLANALKIPLSGSRLSNGIHFWSRGSIAGLWINSDREYRAFVVNQSWILLAEDKLTPGSQGFGMSVRCIKD